MDLLCVMGRYSRDGEVNTHLTVQRHAHTRLVWYSVTPSNRWRIYKSTCRVSHIEVCSESTKTYTACKDIHTHGVEHRGVCSSSTLHLLNSLHSHMYHCLSWGVFMHDHLLIHSSINIVGYNLVPDHCSLLVV